MRATHLCVAVLACALAACSFKVNNDGTSFACGDGGACPSGFTCENAYCEPTVSGVDAATTTVTPPCALDITSGADHSCTVRRDGTVWCWGRNDFGQLGDGTTIDRTTPVAVIGVTGATYVGAGLHHSCAIVALGAVMCWGSDSSGQLGDGGSGASSSPVAAANLSGASSLAGGDDHTCALKNDGTIWCWGDDSAGQLGTPISATPHEPTAIASTTFTWSALAAHGNTTCAIATDQSVKCWGANGGLFGTTSPSNSASPISVPMEGTATAIAVGEKHACAISVAGNVTCWGDNSVGQLGNGTATAATSGVPATTALPVAATALSAGAFHTCALDATGRSWCWGDNDAGELGDGDTENLHNAPVLTLATVADAISSGDHHTCVHHADDSLQCFGGNERGQLGVGTRTSQPAPQAVPGLGSNVAGISAGGDHTCAWLTDGTMRCWGRNDHGELGDGSTIERSSPTTIAVTSVTEVAAGAEHTCAIRSGHVPPMCWGDNSFGQLGDGTLISSLVPVPVADGDGATSDASRISAGGSDTCAVIGTNQTMKCWGDNNDGELGDGVAQSSATPAYAELSGYVDVSVGLDSTCGIFSNGNTRCWGSGTDGQLGDGQEASSSTPQTAGSAIAQISVGDGFACEVTTADAAYCFGPDTHDQIGDGDFTTRDQPFPVTTLPMGGITANAIWAGGSMGCARLSDHSLWCWGVSDDGQQGDYAENDAAVEVLSGSAVSATYTLSIGHTHICMVDNGAAYCWGGDAHGELGDGVDNPLVPRTVALSCPAPTM